MRPASEIFGVVRLTSTGAVDATFGAGALATASFGGTDDADSIILQPTGEIIVIGTTLQNGTAQTAVAAFDSNGQPLTSFGNGGLVTLPGGLSPSSRELHIGDIVFRAFGSRTNDGRVVIGA